MMESRRWISASVVLAASMFASVALAQMPPPPRTAEPLALNGPTVKIAQGEAQGSIVDDVAIFRGLPFAAPPVGDFRWRAPQPPAKWTGVRPANAYSASCRDAEDCLYLNVFGPADATGKKLPVLLYLHGGGFVGGSGAGTDGVQMVKNGVVVVASNYRLGRAGWFAHPALTKESPSGPLGNYGLMDQIATLQWIRDNIAAFGGDAGNVTIAGGSAGAISVNYLMLAPQARGLFHKAISQSGFGRRAADPLPTVEQTGLAFARANGIDGDDAAALKKLRALTWVVMTGATPGVGQAGQPIPMADGKYITGSAFEGFAQGKEARVPYMLGGNSDEASLTRRNTNVPERFAAVKDRRDEFLALFDPDKTNSPERIVGRLITDQSISEPNRALARLHTRNGAPTYVYHFSYVPAAQRATAFGMGHGAETQYVFNQPRGEGGFDAEGKALAASAGKYWAEFARSGNPGNAGGTQWPKYDLANETLLEFPAGAPVQQQRFHAARLDWVERSSGKQGE
jgi:para-nitrobenzyl esterase